jgi:hypothetical protein
VTLRPLERIGRANLQALLDDALEVQRHLGLPATAAVVER